MSSVSQLFLFLNWFGIFIRAVNELWRFIFITGFGDEYNSLNFRCEDPFIVLLNVSWRSKWFSKIECWSDTRAWRGLHIDPLKVCWWSFEFLQSVLGIKGLYTFDLQINYFPGGMQSSFYADQWRDSQNLLLVYS